MKLLKRLFGKPSIPTDPGVRPDPRPQNEKEKDHRVKEVLPTAERVVWKKKPRSEWKRYPVKDQNGSGSCVGQAVALALGAENLLEEDKYLNLSPRSIYARRKNNGRGMWLQDGLHIAYKTGASLEELLPADKKDEEEMNKLRDEKSVDRMVAKVTRAGGYVQSNKDDFDKVAQAIERGKVVIGIIYFNRGQFKNPVIGTNRHGDCGHAIAFTDYTLYNGKRGLVFQNSWGNDWGWDGMGILLSDRKDGFRSWGFFQPLDNEWLDKEDKPTYTFDISLIYQDRNDEVAKLQECLKWEETFPSNIPCTGYYGQITCKAVYDFQVKHQVAGIAELDALEGRRVGPKTRAKLNEIFGD